MHRRGRWHTGHRFAERLANHDLVALRDFDDDRPEVLGLHRLLNDRGDARRLLRLRRCRGGRAQQQSQKEEGKRKKWRGLHKKGQKDGYKSKKEKGKKYEVNPQTWCSKRPRRFNIIAAYGRRNSALPSDRDEKAFR